MIGSTTHGTGFGGLEAYLMQGRGEVRASERVDWTTMRNLLSEEPELAPVEMQAVASQNVRVEAPVYHISLNAAPGEHLTRHQWEQVADRMLAALDLQDHQALIVAHKDRPHEHIHLMVNTVHPVTHRAANLYRDWPRIEKALREVERDFGLRRVPGHHAREPGQEPPDRSVGLTSGERREQLRTAEEPWAEQMRFRLYNDLKEASSWADLEARLAGHGVRLEARGRGLVITDGERQVKLSRLHRGRSAHKLAERYGESFREWRGGVDEVLDAVRAYEKGEERRGRLTERVARAEQALRRADAGRRPLENLGRKALRLHGQLRHQLSGVYRPEELPAVRRRIDAALRSGGDGKAVRKLAAELAARPARLGRLVGRGAPWPNPEQREAASVARHAARTLEQLAETREGLARALPRAAGLPPLGPGQRAPTGADLAAGFRRQRRAVRQARRTVRRGRAALRKIPSRSRLLGRVARTAVRIGFRLVERGAVQSSGAGRLVAASKKAAAAGRAIGGNRLASEAARVTVRAAGGVTAQALGVVVPVPALQVVRLALAAGRGLARAGYNEVREGRGR